MSDGREPEVSTQRRKKRLSKKTKKGWRKGSDIKDVEEFLEQARNDERTGVFDTGNGQLFFIDDKKQSSGKQGRKSATHELKCHRGLMLDSNVPPLHISQKVHKEKVKPIKRSPVEQVKTRPVRQNKLYDLWATDAAVSEDMDEHYAKVCKKQRVKPPSHYRDKPSALQSIEIPQPGASYNPSDNDHQTLLKKAVEIEEKKEKEEKRLKRALDDIFPAASGKSREAVWMQEMSAGLKNDDGDETDKQEEEEKDDAVATRSFNATQNQKKTEKQRRLEKDRLQSERISEKEKQDKLRENQKFRLKSIKKEIKQREFVLATRAAWRELEKEEKKFKPKKLGKLKYEDPTVNVKLSDELSDSLRQLKPEGHIAEAMFSHLQKKNVIETRKRAKPLKRCKSKLFEKKGHRTVTL